MSATQDWLAGLFSIQPAGAISMKALAAHALIQDKTLDKT